MSHDLTFSRSAFKAIAVSAFAVLLSLSASTPVHAIEYYECYWANVGTEDFEYVGGVGITVRYRLICNSLGNHDDAPPEPNPGGTVFPGGMPANPNNDEDTVEGVPRPNDRAGADADQDGIADSWKSVLETTDPCAFNLETNDELGSEHGGRNTERTSHSGIDLEANLGDNVYSMKSGTIATTGYNAGGAGVFVIVNHFDGSQAQYFHLDFPSVATGDPVNAGSHIGYADSTGSSTGHHLHVLYRNRIGGPLRNYSNYTESRPGWRDRRHNPNCAN